MEIILCFITSLLGTIFCILFQLFIAMLLPIAFIIGNIISLIRGKKYQFKRAIADVKKYYSKSIKITISFWDWL